MSSEIVWVGRSPRGKLEVVTCNPTETESERVRYSDLGWEWKKLVSWGGIIYGIPDEWINPDDWTPKIRINNGE